MSRRYHEVLAQHRDRIPGAFDVWVRTHHVEADVADNLYTVATWVKHCSPTGASAEQRSIACMDLAISFFYLDDYAGDDDAQLFAAFERNLGGTPHETTRPAVAAHADLLQRLGALGRPMQWYVALQRKLLAEYRLRNDVIRGRASLSAARHRDARLITIYVYQWVELWQLLDDCPVTPAERESEAFREGVRLTSTYYYLGNELVSLARDIERGEPNLVRLMASEGGLSIDDAATQVAAERDETERLFWRVATRLAEGSEALRKCGALLALCVRAATAARHDNPGRYAPPTV